MKMKYAQTNYPVKTGSITSCNDMSWSVCHVHAHWNITIYTCITAIVAAVPSYILVLDANYSGAYSAG